LTILTIVSDIFALRFCRRCDMIVHLMLAIHIKDV
jgi:hypothetical protein